eukprot:3425348-Amphidinium_carterae.3
MASVDASLAVRYTGLWRNVCHCIALTALLCSMGAYDEEDFCGEDLVIAGPPRHLGGGTLDAHSGEPGFAARILGAPTRHSGGTRVAPCVSQVDPALSFKP